MDLTLPTKLRKIADSETKSFHDDELIRKAADIIEETYKTNLNKIKEATNA